MIDGIEENDGVVESSAEPVAYKNLKMGNKFKGGNFKTFQAPLSPKMAQQ